jgi:hypothetical protein
VFWPTTKEETMARRNATTLSANVQAALLDAPDFLRELTHAAADTKRNQ